MGVKKKGEMNDNIVTCETGYCKIEVSLAHSENLMDTYKNFCNIRSILKSFADQNGLAFLGYGIQPMTSPGRNLLMKKSRNVFWERLFGTDVHLFTISASNQVHIDVTLNEAIDAINVFNGLAGAQIALTANSSIWNGKVDENYKSLGEAFWDWWLARHPGRFGIPQTKFCDLVEYFLCIFDFKPVYVRRGNDVIGLPYCPTFGRYYTCEVDKNRCERYARLKGKCGIKPEGIPVKITPHEEDMSLHFSFFWHNARLSRYLTLENRVNDQQPPDEIMAIPALTLGIMENLKPAIKLVNQYRWDDLRELRVQAIKQGIKASLNGIRISGLSREMLEIAEEGLKKREHGEEVFLELLMRRLTEMSCPADRAERVFKLRGVKGVVDEFKL